MEGTSVYVRTTNVAAFSIERAIRSVASSILIVDDIVVPVDSLSVARDDILSFSLIDGLWTVCSS